MTNFNDLKEKIEKDGFVIIKNLFTKSEIEELEKVCANHCSVTNYQASPKKDALSLKGIDDFILNEKFLTPIKKILDNNIVYFGDSALHCKPNERMFHKDSRGDKLDPSISSYKIYRVGIFLQDHYSFSGGIKFRKGSHKKLNFRLSTIKKILTGKAKLKTFFNFGKIVNARTKIGDIVVWNLRTDHSGGAVINKLFPNLGVLPLIDELTPKFLKKPENQKRMAIFSSFGSESIELENYLNYKVNDKRYSEHWQNSDFNTNYILDKSKKLNLKINSKGLIN